MEAQASLKSMVATSLPLLLGFLRDHLQLCPFSFLLPTLAFSAAEDISA